MEKRSSSRLADDARILRGRTVNAPARHEGVGNALRAAFAPGSYPLPDDFARLLKKIG
jgi:hypothetical protein